MSTVTSKIVSEYWLQKLGKLPVSENEKFQLKRTEKVLISNENCTYFSKITNHNTIVEFTVLFSVYSALLQRYFEPSQFVFSTKVNEEKTPLLFSHLFIEDMNLKAYLNAVKAEIQEVYRYTNFDSNSNLPQKFASYTPFGFGYNVSMTEYELPFVLHVEKTNEGFEASIYYSENFQKSYVTTHFVQNFQRCIENLEANLSAKISEISILTNVEQEKILREFNDTALSFPPESTIADTFEAQVEKAPEHIALIFNDEKYTYRELNEKANALAAYLITDCDIQVNDFVGIKLERTPLLVISLLATLKAGATYVPIDTKYPEERIAYIEKDSNCKLIIDETLPFFHEDTKKYTTENPVVQKSAEDVAYIIYTSGTTGKPKGVMISHQNAVAMIHWAKHTFDAERFEIVFAVTSHCFDLSVYELFYTLATGKKIRLLQNAIEIPAYLEKDSNILINTVPSVMRMLMEGAYNLDNVSIINLAGEPYPLDIAEYLLDKNITTNNLYGPSEDTTYSTAYTLTPQTYDSIPIGKPISNTQAYILDENLQLLPIGVIGKLYLSGLGVTKGYLNRAELTKEKYIQNPFDTSQLMYDTGDLTSWMPDGNIKFYGRKDDQVKLRGYRIELGEIEHQISKFSEEIKGVVVALKTVKSEQSLVGYYVSDRSFEATAIRNYLEEKLPAYMVPAYFQKIEEIPLTPNKKVNKNALPDIIEEVTVTTVYEAPRNPMETALFDIWKTVLSKTNFGINDNFFTLGGHSLMISQIINKMYKTLGKIISYKDFYKNPTIAGVVAQLNEKEYRTIPKLATATAYPVTAAQHRLWLLSKLDAQQSDAYTISGAVFVKGNMNIEAFQKALQHIVDQHEILRTYFKTNAEGTLQQHILPVSEYSYTVELRDLSKTTNQPEATEVYIQQQLQKRFDLENAPLFNIKLIRWNENETVLFIAIHHIISDGWSLEVLTSELVKTYTEIVTNGVAKTALLPIQFKEYASWMNDIQKDELSGQESYWKSQFEGNLPKLNIPIGTNARPEFKTYQGTNKEYVFSKAVLEALKNTSATQQVSLFSMLMSAVKILLHAYSFQKDMIVGTPTAGRIHPDLEQQLGLYVNTLAIRSELAPKDTFKSFVAKEHQRIAEAKAHQEYPFDKLIETLQLERDPSRSPLFDVMVVLQNYQQLASLKAIDSKEITVSPFKTTRNTAQYDLVFTFVEAEALQLELQYNTAIYQSDFINRMCKDLDTVFMHIATKTSLPVNTLQIVSEEEQQIIAKRNTIAVPKATESYTYVIPKTESAQKIAAIWKEILKVDTVSVTDDFFRLGGHSLLLTKLQNAYHKTFEVTVSLQDLYVQTSLQAHEQLVATAKKASYEVIEKIPEQSVYDISATQMRYWMLHKIFGKSKEFNIYDTLSLGSALQIDHFEKAFNLIVKRHEMLRAVFVEAQGIPKQKIIPYSYVSIPFFEDENAAKSFTFDHEFSLEDFPLYKVSLTQIKDDFVLFFNIHHSISDGWSMNIIVNELMETYEALLAGKVPNLPVLSIQYKDYAVWQQQQSQSEALQQQAAYWKKQLSGEIPYLQLPLDYAMSVKTSTTNSAYHTIYLNKDTKHKIETLAGKHKVSVFSIFATTLNILLARLTGEKDITFGIPAANRNHEQLTHIVGSFINTLMLRSTVEKHDNFVNVLTAVNKNLIAALENQNYAFEQLLKSLEIPTQEGRFPISPVFLNLLDFEAHTNEKITSFLPENGHIEASPKFDLECYVKSYANGLALKAVYNQSLFKEKTIAYWMDALVEIMHQVIANDTKQLQDIECFTTYLPKPEAKKLQHKFTYFEADEIENGIAARFEKQVKTYGHLTAVESNGTFLTYTELNQKANQLAHTILKKAPKGKRIALLLPHDEQCVIGMLGSLKAGFAYVPVDIGDPVSRIQYILKDAACDIVVHTQESKHTIAQLKTDLPHIQSIDISEAFLESNTENPAVSIDASAEAYVLYTSGSTGNPKGVLQNQRNVLHYIRVYTNNVHINEKDNVSLFSTYTFDASVKDIYGAILNGATICLYSIPKRGITSLANWFETTHISIIHMVPTIYRYFLKSLPKNTILSTVRLIDLGGEACYKSDIDLFKKHFSKDAFLVNDYGPTEATIVAQNFISHETEITKGNVPLGTVVTDTEVFLLDEQNERCGVYEKGEITFRSDYLSLGYLNLPERTNEVFIKDFEKAGDRIYKSGDIGLLLPTGEIEFLYRKDTQVKYNGVRIELAEIEFHLEQIEGIREAIVAVKNIENKAYITAYVAFEASIAINEIKKALQEKIPAYMIPGIYITMETFPLTRTGKIAKNKLPQPTLADLKSVAYAAPENEQETALVAIWAEVLELDTKVIGVHDNFFELGGNSLQAVVLINKINQKFDSTLSVGNLYETLSIRDVSMLLNFSIQQQNNDDIEQEDFDEIVL